MIDLAVAAALAGHNDVEPWHTLCSTRPTTPWDGGKLLALGGNESKVYAGPISFRA